MDLHHFENKRSKYLFRIVEKLKSLFSGVKIWIIFWEKGNTEELLLFSTWIFKCIFLKERIVEELLFSSMNIRIFKNLNTYIFQNKVLFSSTNVRVPKYLSTFFKRLILWIRIITISNLIIIMYVCEFLKLKVKKFDSFNSVSILCMVIINVQIHDINHFSVEHCNF